MVVWPTTAPQKGAIPSRPSSIHHSPGTTSNMPGTGNALPGRFFPGSPNLWQILGLPCFLYSLVLQLLLSCHQLFCHCCLLMLLEIFEYGKDLVLFFLGMVKDIVLESLHLTRTLGIIVGP